MQGVLFSGINTKFMPRYIESLVPIPSRNHKSFRKWIHGEGRLWSCTFCLKYPSENWGPAAGCGSSAKKFQCNQILIYCNQSKEGSSEKNRVKHLQRAKFRSQSPKTRQRQVFWHYSSLFVFESTIYTGIYKAWKWITAQNTIEV